VITWVQFSDGLPPKIWEGDKNVQNPSRFLTTVDFDREYPRKGSTNRKSKKYLINYDPSHVGRKKLANLGPQTKKLLTWMLTHRSAHFSGDCISALRGCRALKFLHALEIDQALLAHTSTGTGVPPKKKTNRENLKFPLKFSVCTSITSGLMGISSQIFMPTTCRERGVIMWVHFLDGLPPKILDGEKRSKSGGVSDNFRIWSRISRQWIHKSKIEKVADQQQPLLRWAKKLVNFGPQTKKLLTHPGGTLFGRLYFGPYGVMCSQIFIRARDCTRLANAHRNWGAVPPPKKKMMMKN